MGRNPIKENQNPYFRARKQAAEWDARLESRERASELIGIAAYTLADYELGNVKRVPADKVLIMADLYNAPWLLSNYCKNECPICGFLPLATEKMEVWFRYKMERKESYKEQGMKSLLKKTENNEGSYGANEICNLIEDCMANNWKGIIWKILEERKQQRPATRTEQIQQRVSEVDSW